MHLHAKRLAVRRQTPNADGGCCDESECAYHQSKSGAAHGAKLAPASASLILKLSCQLGATVPEINN